MRDLKLFCITDDDQKPELTVDCIHNEMGYKALRENLAGQYNLGNREPNIQVYQVDRRGDRSLLLRHKMHNRKGLAENEAKEVLRHLHILWKFPVKLESVDPSGEVVHRFECPEKNA